jgi:NAD dependent epimerase/dehydratase
MKLSGKKVLVTGAGGFIGSHLAERLVREGSQVTALLHYDARAQRSNLEFVEPAVTREMNIQAGDVRDPFFMNRLIKDCEVVFHLAALIGIPYSYVAPASYVETNIQGTLNVLEAGRAHQVERVIQTSTSECYGTAQYTPIDERHPLHGQSPYAATKIGADKLAESFHLSFGLRVTTVRPFNTFGPRQSARAVIPTMLSQLLAGAGELHLGSLDPVRDLNYVTNTVDGFLALADSEEAIGQVVNVGSGSGVTIEQLAHLAMKVVGREIPIQCDEQRARPPSSEVRTLLCDHTLATQLTGWQPQVDLEQGLRHTAAFIEHQLDLYRPREYAR